MQRPSWDEYFMRIAHEVAKRAVAALGPRMDKQAYPTLRRALKTRTLAVKCAAARALGQLDDLRAVPDLMRVARSRAQHKLRALAIQSLGFLGDKKAVRALGRLADASSGVELLTTRSYSDALKLARELDRANAKRQGIEQNIYKQALEQAEKRRAERKPAALVLSSDDWHVGVVGIVASRLVERFGCPVVLVSMDGDTGRGSARGLEGVHLYDAMLSCADHLQAYGGHRLAAGLTVQRDQLSRFERGFERAIADQQAGRELTKTLKVDGEAMPSAWNTEAVSALQQLQPYGLGNPEPVFLARNLELKGTRAVGREAPYHLKATALDDGRGWDVIGFRMADRIEDTRGPVDLLYTPEFNTWEGQTSIQLRLVDLRPASA